MDRLHRLLPGLWTGMLLCVALIATPAPFALLPTAEAGRVAGRILLHEAYVGLAVPLLLVALERARGVPRRAETLLALAALFCTVAGYFATQPLMAEARAGRGAWSFGQLHAVSFAFFGVKLLIALALAWRVSSAEPTS